MNGKGTRTFTATRIVAAAMVACLAIALLAVPSASATAPPSDAALRAALEAVVDAGATGAIGRVDDGTDVTAMTVGVGRLDPPRPLRVRDQIRAGSITKTVVSTIALQLVGEGRLRLDDTVERWLPGMVPNGAAITIRVLLGHTSGIYDYVADPDWNAAVFADPNRTWSPQELVAVGTAHSPLFSPGQGLSYSNTGYILIGLVLEEATGQPLQDLVTQRVVRPLHLHGTYLPTSARFRGAYAHGYFPPSFTGDGYLDVSSFHPSIGWAAGGLVSTAPDLARFYQALLAGQLLTPALLNEMTTTGTSPDYPGIAVGLGIWSIETPCGTVWGHEGGIPGYKSFAISDRDGTRSAVVTVLTELDDAIGAAFEAAVAAAACRMLDGTAAASGRRSS